MTLFKAIEENSLKQAIIAFIAGSENLTHFVSFGINTNKMQSAVNVFKLLKDQVLRQIIIATTKFMRAETHQSLFRIDRDIVSPSHDGHWELYTVKAQRILSLENLEI